MVLLESINLPMGQKAGDFRLPDILGKNYGLADFREAKVLVIVFMCNHCPYVKAVLERLVDLQKRFLVDGVQFVGINPNFGSPGYEEEESLSGMKKMMEEYAMNFPYLIDETQEVAKNYKAQCTPDIYLFDQERKLRYHGRIDDNWKEPEAVKKQELALAIEALVASKLPEEIQYPAMGCSIKWK